MTVENEYTDTLKRIKEIEETSSLELAQRKKSLEDELRHLEEDAAKALEAARAQADLDLAEQVETARSSTQLEADKVLASAQKGSDAIMAKKLDKKDFKKVIDDIVLAEFKEV
jgi:vacuolar-type H+-ATPase subunit H